MVMRDSLLNQMRLGKVRLQMLATFMNALQFRVGHSQELETTQQFQIHKVFACTEN